MILLDFLNENHVVLTPKGKEVVGKAIIEMYPNLRNMYVDHDYFAYWTCKIIKIYLPEKDCLKILQLAARYSKIWAFA